MLVCGCTAGDATLASRDQSTSDQMISDRVAIEIVDDESEAILKESGTTPIPTVNVTPGLLVSTSSSSMSTPQLMTPEPSFSYSLLIGDPHPRLPRYHRDEWKHWIDADGDCHNTRAEVLMDEALAVVEMSGCRVVSGQWLGLYTGIVVSEANALDVDHMVPLADAHRSGGWVWDASRKRAYANHLDDPDHLIAVTASANRSKGASAPDDWRPSDRTYWCEYAIDWARIKETWNLSVRHAELKALQEMVVNCPMQVRFILLDASRSIDQLAKPTPSVASGAVRYDPFGPDRDCSDFNQWTNAQSFFEASGGPARDLHRLDGNKDGIACNRLPGAP